MTRKRTNNRRERNREHLTPDELQKLLDAVKTPGLSRNPERDYCLILLMAHHGLRVSEACALKLSDVQPDEKTIYIKRLKNGKSTSHPLYNGEVRALRDWLKIRASIESAYDTLLLSEQRKPLSRRTVWLMMNKYAKAAGLEALSIHPHMLRHAAGYHMANRGADTRLIQEFLGHRSISNTVRYTELSAARFANVW
jgi:type 1 fimbriae regulatory protein FimB